MGFTHIQGNAGSSGSATTLSVVLTSAPSLGDVVCVGLLVSVAITALTIKDANNNSYIVTPNSPASVGGLHFAYTAYLLSAPANASATVTASWTTPASPVMWVEEFSVSGGTAAFDTDIAGSNAGSGTAINTPSITPGGTNELVFAVTFAANTISSPIADGTQGSWTGVHGGIISGNMAEYDLSVSSAQAVDYVQSPAGTWAGMAMAFSFTPVGVSQDKYQPIYADYQWLGGDE